MGEGEREKGKREREETALCLGTVLAQGELQPMMRKTDSSAAGRGREEDPDFLGSLMPGIRVGAETLHMRKLGALSK